MSHVSQLLPSSVKSDFSKKKLSFRHGPELLFHEGFSLNTEVSAASDMMKEAAGDSGCALSTRGLLDTGATRTAIDISLAKKLNLTPVGYNKIHTAAGLVEALSYTVAIYFIGTRLKPLLNLKVSSCDLGLSGHSSSKQPGLLIGRDIMMAWNITWHGPTSSVFISD